MCVSVDFSLVGEHRKNKFRKDMQNTELNSNKRVLTKSTVLKEQR